VTGVCDDEGTYVKSKQFIHSDNLYVACSRSRPTLRTYSLLCATQHLLVLTKLNSDDAEFMAYIKSKYVTWFLFYDAKSS
jgi:hypothetical protein